jgi:hypothetical protein
MEKGIDLLRAYLVNSIRALSEPRQLLIELQARESRLKDSLTICALLSICSLSLSAMVTGANFALTLDLAWVLIPIIGIYFIIKLSWKIVRESIPIEIALCQALLAFGVIALISSITFATGMGAIKLYQPDFFSWLYKNSLANFLHFALAEPEKIEPYSEGKGIKIMVFSAILGGLVASYYWVAFWRAGSRYLNSTARKTFGSVVVSIALFYCMNLFLNFLWSF